MRNLATVFVFLVLSGGVHEPSLGAEWVAELEGEKLEEKFTEEVPVSGRVVAGVAMPVGVAGSDVTVTPPDSLTVPHICVQVISQDGRYWAMNTFRLPDGAGSVPVGLEYYAESAHKKFLEKLTFSQVAVLGAVGKCGAENDTYIIASSGLPLQASGQDKVLCAEGDLCVFVNAGRTDTYLFFWDDHDRRRQADCDRIEEGRRTGFDTICRIDLRALADSLDRLDLRILRRRYESTVSSTDLNVLLPRLD